MEGIRRDGRGLLRGWISRSRGLHCKWNDDYNLRIGRWETTQVGQENHGRGVEAKEFGREVGYEVSSFEEVKAQKKLMKEGKVVENPMFMTESRRKELKRAHSDVTLYLIL